MAIWFIADLHIGHRNILRYCSRPFADVEEQTETIVNNWNSRASEGDAVYLLGDVGYGSPQYLYRVLERLNGTIYLLKGNHDASALKQPAARRFAWIKDTYFLKTQLNGEKYEIFLSHYPHRSWPNSNKGSFHLFGHTHGNMPPYGRSFDVGVDCTNYTPLSLEEVVEKMTALPVQLDYTPKVAD